MEWFKSEQNKIVVNSVQQKVKRGGGGGNRQIIVTKLILVWMIVVLRKVSSINISSWREQIKLITNNTSCRQKGGTQAGIGLSYNPQDLTTCYRLGTAASCPFTSRERGTLPIRGTN